MKDLMTSLRLVILSVLICSVMYPAILLAFGQAIVPGKADGSLITDERGRILGSAQIAQGFTRPQYFWPRPSAVDYAAHAAGGSNLSPTNRAIGERAEALLQALDATDERPAPAELVLASGSGLDPHLTLGGAHFQIDRIARARGVSPQAIQALVDEVAQWVCPGQDEGRLVNVLRLNLALDRRFPLPPDVYVR